MQRFIGSFVFWYCSVAFALEVSIDSECVGCHLPQRAIVESKFASGLGKWNNSQCYGCHYELVEVAANHREGRKDSRFSALPISDSRLKQMAHRPLPYLDASEQPWRHEGLERVNSTTLAKYLKRPHGFCAANGECLAPKMTAYPEAEQYLPNHPMPSKEASPSDIELGQSIFESKCKVCHQYSDVSGYDAVALSLFSAGWVFNYANHMQGTSDTRKMPKVPLTRAEANALFDFFQKERSERERSVDAAVIQALTDLNKVNKGISDQGIEYIWSQFWRDGDCVHCHAIGGRATESFDTSLPGIVKWLKNNEPMELADRLVIRHVEKTLGMGAAKPGMPMTGEPVPEAAITLIRTWIHRGCPDLDKKTYCEKQAQ